MPEGGFGPVLPPELVVEGAREGPGDLGASEVVLLKDLVVPPATGDVGTRDTAQAGLCPSMPVARSPPRGSASPGGSPVEVGSCSET